MHWKSQPLTSNQNKSFKREEGFTLLELLVALSVSSICFLLLAIGVNQIRRIHEEMKNDPQIEWHLFLNQLEHYVQDSEFVRVEKDALVVRKAREDNGRMEQISYSRYNNMIRRQVFGEGHQPMLMHLRSFTFAKEKEMIILQAEFQNGDSYRARLNVRSWEETNEE